MELESQLFGVKFRGPYLEHWVNLKKPNVQEAYDNDVEDDDDDGDYDDD